MVYHWVGNKIQRDTTCTKSLKMRVDHRHRKTLYQTIPCIKCQVKLEDFDTKYIVKYNEHYTLLYKMLLYKSNNLDEMDNCLEIH